MRKEVVSIPLLPFTAAEEEALVEKLAGMDVSALTHYVESAHLALANKALDPSWRPRVELGLQRAEVALSREALRAAEAAEMPIVTAAPAPKPKARSKAKPKIDAEAEVEAEAEPEAETKAVEAE